jgi:DNA-binding ferritin-like protein
MKLSTNVHFLLETQLQIKINHWQTKGFARHNAFGGFYDALDELIDTFVESAMGKYGRFVLSDEEKTIQLSNLSELDPKAMLNTVREALIQMSDEFEETDTDLMNIRDEILGELNKLAYLLTLE